MTPDIREQLARALSGTPRQPMAPAPMEPLNPSPTMPPMGLPQGRGLPQEPPLDQKAFEEWLQRKDNADWYQRVLRPGS